MKEVKNDLLFLGVVGGVMVFEFLVTVEGDLLLSVDRLVVESGFLIRCTPNSLEISFIDFLNKFGKMNSLNF